QQLDQWFASQAASDADDCAEMVASLTRHHAYSPENATRVRALLDTFTANQGAFHHRSGLGYQIVADAVAGLDAGNPRLAARYAKQFAERRRFNEERGRMMLEACRTLAQRATLSSDVAEI